MVPPAPPHPLRLIRGLLAAPGPRPLDARNGWYPYRPAWYPYSLAWYPYISTLSHWYPYSVPLLGTLLDLLVGMGY